MNAALRHPLLRAAAAALLAGALGFFAIGDTPNRVPATLGDAVAWALPALPAAAPAAPWASPVWASQPASFAPADAIKPPPRLIGTVLAGGRLFAVFVMPDGARVRAALGERLPDGAEVTAIAPTRAAWRDADGRQHDARLLDARSP